MEKVDSKKDEEYEAPAEADKKENDSDEDNILRRKSTIAEKMGMFKSVM